MLPGINELKLSWNLKLQDVALKGGICLSNVIAAKRIADMTDGNCMPCFEEERTKLASKSPSKVKEV